MAEMVHDQTEIKETDIIFDCPHCGKSLAIDYRGAGLSVPCTDCGKNVLVPIPEGMEITDIDTTEEEQEIQILNLRKSLAAAELRVDQLTRELEEVTFRREKLEKFRSDNIVKFGAILEKATGVQKALEEASKALHKIIETAKEETQPRNSGTAH